MVAKNLFFKLKELFKSKKRLKNNKQQSFDVKY